jgi:hypothetical protein
MLEQFTACRDNLHIRLRPEQLQQAGEARTVFRAAEAIAYFRKDKLGGDERAGRLLAQRAGLTVVLVGGVEQGEKVNRVGEHRFHRRDAPWR